MKLPDELIRPIYIDESGASGRTIASVPATVASLLGAAFDGLPPLPPALWQPLADDCRRVVVILLDAVGQNYFDADPDLGASLREKAVVRGNLTSVCPSSTAIALTSIWTGQAPAGHGLLGTHLFLEAYGALTQMLALAPSATMVRESMLRAGLEPETFLPVPGVAEQLAPYGIETHSFVGKDIVDSPLSRMHNRGGQRHSYLEFTDMLWQVRRLLAEKTSEKVYAYAYWPHIDTLSHIYDPHHPVPAAALSTWLGQIEAFLLAPLQKEGRGDTAVFIFADHGHVASRRDPVENVHSDEHPEFTEQLLMRSAVGARLPHFFARQGRVEAARDYAAAFLADKMALYSGQEFLDSGLLGPPPHADVTLRRLGDLVGVMRHNYAYVNPGERKLIDRFRGGHGGLTPDEMIVPWWGFRV